MEGEEKRREWMREKPTYEDLKGVYIYTWYFYIIKSKELNANVRV